ncbi:MAG: M20/M25/M40 family metallo-hydrolase [Planctomycetota bacterium]
MSRKLALTLLIFALGLLLFGGTARAGDVWVQSMDLAVRLDPPKHRIEGKAVLRLAPARKEPAVLSFRMHAGLEVKLPDGVAVDSKEVEGWWQVLSVTVPPDRADLEVRYAGEIYDAVQKSDALAFVVGDDTRGVIGEEGVYLASGSGWYPLTEGVVTFAKIEVDGPGDWRVVTQGKRAAREVVSGREKTVWTNEHRMDGLALSAGNYVVTTREMNGVAISTYLYPEDQQYAEVLLAETARYFEFYRPILGDYPWPKFDIVENFFASGYGMPTYTLLGKTVIPHMVRMAARYGGKIPAGYIAHELVHCWWGNWVYPDYASGNWCEGLTSWYANYLMKDATDPEKAFEHRRKISTTFSIRVDPSNDYPVREFRGKTEDFENDIGYGKACMLFHMLALRVGYDTYFETMRGIVRDYGGKRAAWDDFEAAFSKAAGEDLGWFFDQWLDRTGAPDLSLDEKIAVERREDGLFVVRGKIRENPAEKPWRVRVPVALVMPGARVYANVEVSDHETDFEIVSPRVPVSVEIDPRFFLFRNVPLDEIQPCLNLTLSRPDKVYVVPEGNAAYAQLAGMGKGSKGGEIVSAAAGLPKKDCVVFGRPEENPATAAALAAAGVTLHENAITIRGKKYEGEDLWVQLSIRHPAAEGKFVTVFFGMTEKALGRAQVVFRYGWDGHMVYRGRRPLTRGDFTKITRRTARQVEVEADAVRIEETIRTLAAPGMEGRLTGATGAKAFEAVKAAVKATGATQVEEHDLSFPILDFDDPDAWTVRQGKVGAEEWVTSYPDAVIPAVFSKESAAVSGSDGEVIAIRRIATWPAKADEKTLLVLPVVEDPTSLMTILALLTDSPAAALAVPMASLEHRAMQNLAAYPKRLGDLREAAGRQARAAVPPFEMPMPVIFLDERIVPPNGTGPADARLRVAFTKKLVAGRNLVVTVLPSHGDGKAPAVGLGAHFDGCGKGYPSADDNATGVAAVLETLRELAARKDLLARPVRVFFFDGEEWGLRGSRAMAMKYAGGLRAFVNLDTVGAADQAQAYVIGRGEYPHLSARAISCLTAEGFAIGKDIDRFAFAHGSDHWPFHRKGVPAIDLWSGQYRRMNTKDDTIDRVDFAKVAAISRATTRLVLDLATEK